MLWVTRQTGRQQVDCSKVQSAATTIYQSGRVVAATAIEMVAETISATGCTCIRIITGRSGWVIEYASHEHHRPVGNVEDTRRCSAGMVASRSEQQMSFRCLISHDYNQPSRRWILRARSRSVFCAVALVACFTDSFSFCYERTSPVQTTVWLFARGRNRQQNTFFSHSAMHAMNNKDRQFCFIYNSNKVETRLSGRGFLFIRSLDLYSQLHKF